MNNKIVLLSIVSMLLFSTVMGISFILPVRARTWAVDDDGEADFRTIQEAINAASPEDTIFVYSGTYREHLYIEKPLRLMGEYRHTTIIDGGGEGIVIDIVDTENVTIEGFAITGSGSEFIAPFVPEAVGWPESGIVVRGKSHGCVIRNNIVRGNNIGIYITGLGWARPYDSPSNVSILSNVVADNKRVGIAILYETKHTIIAGNVIANHSDGLFSSAGCVGVLVYHNNFINNTCNAIATRSEVYLDNGYPSGGNYWSDYNGTDLYSGPGQNVSGSDGIGDTPYKPFPVELPNFWDNYPLMGPMLKTDVNTDGKVNVEDIFAVAKAFGSYMGHPRWVPMYDINGDGEINIKDLFAIAKDFGKEW